MRKLILPLRPSLTLASLAMLLGGCATLVPTESCEQFEARRKQVNYATEYRRDEKQTVTPMRKGSAAMAMQYRLRLDPERVHSCSHVTIHKELVLSRRDDAGVTLEETREFFAEDGTRIAIKNENVSSQVRQSGRYTAAVLLPIPKNAPAGAYHLVSTLILKMKGTAENQVLAKTTVSFEVVPSK
ncbi:MAG TPA: hypothetical protein VES91_00130 [Burkholderiaceae bacterium]|nr:hypothetical protein [Burkholderiaceae bacterium]